MKAENFEIFDQKKKMLIRLRKDWVSLLLLLRCQLKQFEVKIYVACFLSNKLWVVYLLSAPPPLSLPLSLSLSPFLTLSHTHALPFFSHFSLKYSRKITPIFKSHETFIDFIIFGENKEVEWKKEREGTTGSKYKFN